jgi:hypothetical protein
MNFTYYKFLDLAPLPQTIIDRVLSVDMDQQNIAPSHQYSDQDKKLYTSRILVQDQLVSRHVRQTRYNLDHQVLQWIKKEIAGNFLECTATIGDPQQGHTGPHTDRARNFALLYVLTSGGTNVLTTFWQEKNFPLIRPKGTLINEYNRLTMMDQVNYGQHRWVIMDSRILHSVQNLESSRFSIQIAFDDLDEIEKRVGHLGFAPF